MKTTRNVLITVAACLGLFCSTPAFACTGIHLTAKDGSMVYARTLELGADLESNMLVVPRGYEFVGDTPTGKPGLRWTTKYGFVGPNLLGQPFVCDGMNEKGLAVGCFLFPGSAGYQKIEPSNATRAIASYQVSLYLLGNCATVKDAVAAFEGMRVGVGTAVEGVPTSLLQLHYAVQDAEGNSVVVEYVNGQLNVHENKLGVVTNSPDFDWHQTNLRNYVHLSPNNASPVDMSGYMLTGFGQGTGMWGLPGDFTPPSRFVRAVAFTQAAVASDTAEQCVEQAFHLLNQFDLPRGAIRAADSTKTDVEFTNWTTAADVKHLRYYFHTYKSRVIRMVDLNKMDFNAKNLKTISMGQNETIEDVSKAAK
jgi:choloylglycine hydrolase